MRGREDVLNTLREAFAKDPKIHAERIRVSLLSPDSIAIEGEVQTLAEKEEVAFLARQIAPQCEIDNSLTVAGNRLMRDQDLTQRAQEELINEGLPGTLGVEVHDGVAVLRGSVESLELRHKGKLAVARVPGIREVDEDHVALSTTLVAETIGPERTTLPSGAVLVGPGAEIVTGIDAASVVSQLEERLATELQPPRADEIKVVSKGGSVRLLGYVKNAAERGRAEHVAMSVPGVRTVENLLVALDGSMGCNEALEAEIRRGLGRHGDHVSPVDIKVYVVGDTAYLQGTVDFPEQVMQAEAIARRTPGIVYAFCDLKVSERHPRSGKGPGHAVENALEQLKREGLEE